MSLWKYQITVLQVLNDGACLQIKIVNEWREVLNGSRGDLLIKLCFGTNLN